MKLFSNEVSFLILLMCFVASLTNQLINVAAGSVQKSARMLQADEAPNGDATETTALDETAENEQPETDDATADGTAGDEDFFNGQQLVSLPSDDVFDGLPENNGNYNYALDGKTVYFKSSFNNLCINTRGGVVDGEPKLTIFTCSENLRNKKGDNQLFMMDSTSGMIKSVLDNSKCMGLRGPLTPDGTPIQLFDCDETNMKQKWYWNANGKKLKSQWNNSRCITGGNQGQFVRATKCAANVSRQVWTQTIKKAVAPQDETNDEESGDEMDEEPSDVGEIYTGGGTTVFVLQSALTDQCINVRESDTNNSPILRLSKCVGNENQQWTMDPTTGDIRSEIGGNQKYCIGLPGPYSRPATASGTEVQLVECSTDEDEGIVHSWRWNSNGRKLKSQWRKNKCMTAGGGVVTVSKCQEGVLGQIWLRAQPPGSTSLTTEATGEAEETPADGADDNGAEETPADGADDNGGMQGGTVDQAEPTPADDTTTASADDTTTASADDATFTLENQGGGAVEDKSETAAPTET